MRDHEPITISDFRGLFNRGEAETVPQDFFSDSHNIRFNRHEIKTRFGSSIVHVLSSVRRVKIYKRIGEAQRLIILNGVGELYDSTNLATPILTVSGMTDFSMASIFNRAYITPHDGITGLAGEKVYVYNGSGVARAAAGTAPTAALVVSDGASTGFVEEGLHLFAYAFETASGYITKPGGYVSFTTVGGKRLDIDTIGVGPAGTVARVIIATRTIVGGFNGDFEHQTWYLVPGGRIADNTSTSLSDTLSFFDLDLAEDVSYLIDQITEIPAGVGIGLYNSRMIVWGENANQSIVRASTVGEPESFDDAEGFVTINPGDAGSAIKNCFEYNTLLIVQKANRTYYTQDNLNNAAFWPSKNLDDSIGGHPHGVAQILDYGHQIENLVISAHQTGLRVFNGSFSTTPLSYNIDNIWERINKKYFHTVEAVINALDMEIYIAVPLDAATTPSHILYGDFSEGLTWETIKWSIDSFPYAPQTIVADLDNTNDEVVIKIGSLTGNIYKIDETLYTDNLIAQDSYVEFPLLPVDGDDTIYHFTGARVRAKGSGSLAVTVKSLDDVLTATGESITLAASPGKGLFSGFNFTAERCKIKFRVSDAGANFKLNRMSLYMTPVWEQR